ADEAGGDDRGGDGGDEGTAGERSTLPGSAVVPSHRETTPGVTEEVTAQVYGTLVEAASAALDYLGTVHTARSEALCQQLAAALARVDIAAPRQRTAPPPRTRTPRSTTRRTRK